jgi:hypothetical protein
MSLCAQGPSVEPYFCAPLTRNSLSPVGVARLLSSLENRSVVVVSPSATACPVMRPGISGMLVATAGHAAGTGAGGGGSTAGEAATTKGAKAIQKKRRLLHGERPPGSTHTILSSFTRHESARDAPHRP